MEQHLDVPKMNVKVIVNPKLYQSYSLKFELFPRKITNLKIIIQKSVDLSDIVLEIQKTLPVINIYDISYIRKNTPLDVRNNFKFKLEIQKQFGILDKTLVKIIEPDISQHISLIKTHIKTYGSAPNFQHMEIPKELIKIQNYIRSTLNKPDMSLDLINKIASTISKESC